MNIRICRLRRFMIPCALLMLATSTALSLAAPQALQKSIKVKMKLDKDNNDKGADIGFVVVARNTSDKTVVLHFSTSRTFDFLISSRSNNTVVWQRSHGTLFTQANKQIVLAPGEKVDYRGRWNQKTNNGTVVAPGAYSVVGIITEKSGDLTSEAANFKIKDN